MGAHASLVLLADTATQLQRFVSVFVGIYILLILVYILSTWIRMPYSRTLSTAQSFLNEVVVPYLRVFRGRIPTLGPIDLSPIVAIIVLLIAERLVISAIGALF